jgi:hypothetical protein
MQSLSAQLDVVQTQLNAVMVDYQHKQQELARLGQDAAVERRLFADFHLAPHKLVRPSLSEFSHALLDLTRWLMMSACDCSKWNWLPFSNASEPSKSQRNQHPHTQRPPWITSPRSAAADSFFCFFSICISLDHNPVNTDPIQPPQSCCKCEDSSAAAVQLEF